ncbi:MAG: phage Gp19/Gp15/Gp42 family protein [Clostridia bacterium]|nr:phage Gp19/Gp15/Gp42 family protein [Clostridia bacterium]
MGAVYAAVADIQLFRPLTAQEQEQAEALLDSASAKLRLLAKKYGCDLDGMIADDPDHGTAVKSVVVQAVIRALNSVSDNSPPAVQSSQAAMGYSVSMTWLASGQALYYLKNELKDLGLLRQRFGALEVYDLGDKQD